MGPNGKHPYQRDEKTQRSHAKMEAESDMVTS